MVEETLRRLPVNLIELASAFQEQPLETSWFFDTETGEEYYVTNDISEAVEQIMIAASQELGQDVDLQVYIARCEALIAESGSMDWEQEIMLDSLHVQIYFGDSVVRVPQLESHDAWEDMADFVATLPPGRLRQRLENAIAGKGAFRRFRDIVFELPQEKERWYAFQNERMRQHVLEWLESLGIEPVERPREDV